MKKNKHLDPIIAQAVKASFKDGKLIESQAGKLVKIFKKLPKNEAIYLISSYLKGLRREMAFHELVLESAIPLSKSETDSIKNRLAKSYQLTFIRSVQNADVLGGVKVKVADTVYDYSLKNKIAQVKEVLTR
jgi:F0F1-type ATP synthase delta subunit